jgi:hypothetical protein
MLHLLLTILALLAIWKLLAHSGASSTSLLTGLRRLALVLAIAGAALGGLIGYFATQNCHTDGAIGSWVTTCNGPDPGAIALGILAGFGAIWMAASVLIWIIRGFLTR